MTAVAALLGSTVVLAGCGSGSSGANPSYFPSSAFIGLGGQQQQKSVLWIGDSYAAGAGAGSAAKAESCLTARALQLTCDLDGEGGTGFVASGHQDNPAFVPLAGRLAQDKAKYGNADFIVIDAGRNDDQTAASTRAAVISYFQQLRADFPSVPVAIIAPYFMTENENATHMSFVAFLRQQATAEHFAGVVDPIGSGWISDALTGSMTIADHVHPTPAGHAYIAAHLAPELAALGIGSEVTTASPSAS